MSGNEILATVGSISGVIGTARIAVDG